MIFLTCALEKPSLRYFFAVIPLTVLIEYGKIEVYCRWCTKIHCYTLTEEGLKVETW